MKSSIVVFICIVVLVGVVFLLDRQEVDNDINYVVVDDSLSAKKDSINDSIHDVSIRIDGVKTRIDSSFNIEVDSSIIKEALESI